MIISPDADGNEAANGIWRALGMTFNWLVTIGRYNL
jgi:hypothetical protein